MMLQAVCALVVVACISALRVDACRVAVIGGGIGGTGAAYYLKKARPACQVTLYERGSLGGRVQEFTYDGKTYEAGASIIHARNWYMLEAIEDLNLTATTGDDTQATFSIYDGQQLVYTQDDGLVGSFKALARYGLSPLRFSQLSIAAGRSFGSIYPIQADGTWFRSPDEMLDAMGLLDKTMTSLAEYGQAQLSWWWRWGSATFLEELAGAVNRINYNQRNEQLNALAGLVSFLPAAEPLVYSVKEGNAQVAARFAAAADLEALHLGTQVDIIRALPNGTWQLVVSPAASQAASQDGGMQQQLQQEVHGPYDAVILAAPLVGSRLKFEGCTLPPITPRPYQSTVTTYVAGVLNPAYFQLEELPDGDFFVTNSAATNWTVVALKGPGSSVSSGSSSRTGKTGSSPHRCHHHSCQGSKACHQHRQCAGSGSWQHWWRRLVQRLQPGLSGHLGCGHKGPKQQQHQQQQQEQQQEEEGQQHQREGEDKQDQANAASRDPPMVQLYKLFSEQPLSEEELGRLFLQHEVVHSHAWKAYPKYSAPETLPPFLLSPGLIYNNALEAAASAMEVALVAAKNSMLLVDHHLSQRAEHGREWEQEWRQQQGGAKGQVGHDEDQEGLRMVRHMQQQQQQQQQQQARGQPGPTAEV